MIDQLNMYAMGMVQKSMQQNISIFFNCNSRSILCTASKHLLGNINLIKFWNGHNSILHVHKGSLILYFKLENDSDYFMERRYSTMHPKLKLNEQIPRENAPLGAQQKISFLLICTSLVEDNDKRKIRGFRVISCTAINGIQVSMSLCHISVIFKDIEGIDIQPAREAKLQHFESLKKNNFKETLKFSGFPAANSENMQ